MQKQSFWQDKNRRLIFVIGIIFAIAGSAYTAFSIFADNNWKKASITNLERTGVCQKGDNYRLTYKVDNRDYQINTCASQPPTVAVVLYNPSSPSIALLNQAIVNEIIGGMFAVLGLLFVFGVMFLRDPKPGELGYSPPTNSRPPLS